MAQPSAHCTLALTLSATFIFLRTRTAHQNAEIQAGNSDFV